MDGTDIQVDIFPTALTQTRILAFGTSSLPSSMNAFKLIRPKNGRPLMYPRGMLQLVRSKHDCLSTRIPQPGSLSGKILVISDAARFPPIDASVVEADNICVAQTITNSPKRISYGTFAYHKLILAHGQQDGTVKEGIWSADQYQSTVILHQDLQAPFCRLRHFVVCSLIKQVDNSGLERDSSRTRRKFANADLLVIMLKLQLDWGECICRS
jgi:hypothetical protein